MSLFQGHMLFLLLQVPRISSIHYHHHTTTNTSVMHQKSLKMSTNTNLSIAMATLLLPIHQHHRQPYMITAISNNTLLLPGLTDTRNHRIHHRFIHHFPTTNSMNPQLGAIHNSTRNPLLSVEIVTTQEPKFSS